MKQLTARASSRRPPIAGHSAGRLTIESGADSITESERVAVLAHWSSDAEVSRSTRELVRQLRDRTYAVYVVSTATCQGELRWSGPLRDHVVVARRENAGYDFGSWAAAFNHWPNIAQAEHVLLLNDSLVGPFRSIHPILDTFERSKASVWGMTSTLQRGWHLQSFGLGFRRGSLTSPEIAAFWRQVKIESSKEEVIRRYELGFGRLLRKASYTVDVAFPHGIIVPADENPTIVGWRRLLDRGFPFVKRELVRGPHLARDGSALFADLRARYGVDVEDWI